MLRETRVQSIRLCVWKQTNHGIEERRKWGVRDCSLIVSHQRNKMAIPRKPAVCGRQIVACKKNKRRQPSRLSTNLLFFLLGYIPCRKKEEEEMILFFFSSFFLSICDLSFRLFDCYACLAFMLFWRKERESSIYSLLLFSSLRCCVRIYICFSTKWCADCRSRGFGSYGFPCNLSLYRYIVARLRALSAAVRRLLRNLFSLSLFLALLFDTLFNHWLYTITAAAAAGRSAFCVVLGAKKIL